MFVKHRHCSICSIKYPNDEKFISCPVCGDETTVRNETFDADWLQLAYIRVTRLEGGVPDQALEWIRQAFEVGEHGEETEEGEPGAS